MMHLVRRLANVTAMALLIPLAACQQQRTLVTAPYVMRGDAGRAVFGRVDPAHQTPDIPVLYVTDRAPDRTGPAGPEYGYKRNRHVQYGVATVGLKPEPTWDQLVADTVVEKPSRRYPISLKSVEPLGQFRNPVELLTVKDGRLEATEGFWAAFQADYAGFNAAVARWLDHTPVKDAYVFVHGYNNKFHDAVYRMAESWHYLGRQGVPIVFTWPAGSGGLKGYAYDRESGEFAIVHLKMLLMALARNPQVERVHLLSHSRGTDVATTALRELHGEVRAATGRSLLAPLVTGHAPMVEEVGNAPMTWEVLKIRTLVLASPDLDLQVFTQRFFGENLVRGAERTVIYFSEHDKALGLADWLFRSSRRVGALHPDDLPPESRPLLAQLSAIELVNCEVKGGGSTHSYLFQHPAAFSDLILLLREGHSPGAEKGRPLTREDDCLWLLSNDYMMGGVSPLPPR